MKKQSNKGRAKKPISKRGWFWIIVAVVLIAPFWNHGENGIENRIKGVAENMVEEQNPTECQDEDAANDDLDFLVLTVNNDVTGNWRVATISKDIQMEEHAVEYYKKYFQSDNEIHAIVNFYYRTTTSISVLFGNILDVTVFEYVDKEEHDAKLLFSGMLLKEYFVNIDTGEIEEIQ